MARLCVCVSSGTEVAPHSVWWFDERLLKWSAQEGVIVWAVGLI
jgi:hypothetical protein